MPAPFSQRASATMESWSHGEVLPICRTVELLGFPWWEGISGPRDPSQVSRGRSSAASCWGQVRLPILCCEKTSQSVREAISTGAWTVSAKPRPTPHIAHLRRRGAKSDFNDRATQTAQASGRCEFTMKSFGSDSCTKLRIRLACCRKRVTIPKDPLKSRLCSRMTLAQIAST